MATVFVSDTDTLFPTHYQPGDPDPECSRCGKLIPAGTHFVRAHPTNEAGEYHYHTECIAWCPEHMTNSTN